MNYRIIAVEKSGVWHKILDLGNGFGIHNTPDKGIVIEPIADITNGRKYWVCERVASHFSDSQLIQRAQFLAANRKYRATSYNCEDFIEELIGNAPKSKQRNAWIFACSMLVLAFAAARS